MTWLVLIGLGAVAGAVLPDVSGAQVPVRRDTVGTKRDTARTRVDTAGGRRNLPPAGADTIKVPVPPKADSMIRNDSINKGIVPLPPVAKKDTIKAPLPRAEGPPVLDLGAPRVYDRTAMFATGALTLVDLLGRVPGLTAFTTGFLAAPALIASQGNLHGVRIFLDGLELDPMDLRARGVTAANDLPLNALEEIRIERGAEEVRVYARSWRVDRTVPYTRADIATGDQNSNLYRAWFGRRYAHGEALQVSAEQYTTQPNSRLPSSDVLNVMLRAGITHGPWSTDGTFLRTHRNRAPWSGVGTSAETRDTVAGIETNRSTAYVRLGNGDPEAGRWMQFVASAQAYTGSPRSSTSVSYGTSTDSTSTIADSVAYESQYLLTGGINRGVVHLSGAERVRVGGHRTSHVMSGRANSITGPLAVSLYAEGKSYLAPARQDATARLSFFDRIALVASASRTGSGTFDRLFDEPRNGSVYGESGAFTIDGLGPFVTPDTSQATRYQLASTTNLRAEAGIRLRDLWLSAGLLRRGATTLIPPGEIGTEYAGAPAVRPEGAVTGKMIAARGRLWRAVNADAWAVAWDDTAGAYRPRYQTRGELYIQTNLLDKFPGGNFGLLTSLAHEYRSSTVFPVTPDSSRIAPGYRAITFKLEIRVQTAVVSYQFRNLLQERYQQIPGFPMPRQTQFYGVRWDFWN
ncbi:MAG: Plug domain-containing protein [bacterium]